MVGVRLDLYLPERQQHQPWYPRTVKVRSSSGTILRIRYPRSGRGGPPDDGKVKQRVVADLGRKADSPRRDPPQAPTTPHRRGRRSGRRSHRTPDRRGRRPGAGPRRPAPCSTDWASGRSSTKNSAGPKAFRSPTAPSSLVANRLIAPASEHGPAGWLETHFVCDRRGRAASSPIGTGGRPGPRPSPPARRPGTSHPRSAPPGWQGLGIEVGAVSPPPRPLSSFEARLRPLHDITSTYFEGAGPRDDFARHGYSRDGKPQNVQVIVGVVMVAGWPDRPSCLGGQPHRPFHGPQEAHPGFAPAVRVRPAGLRRRDRGMVTDENIAALTREGHGLPRGGQAAARIPGSRPGSDAVDETK